MNKKIVSTILAIVITVAIVGAYHYPKSEESVSLAGSTAGSVFNSAKFAGVVVDLSTPGANGTSTSILNSDASDRFISGFRVGCNGVATSRTAYTGVILDALKLTIGTSTDSAPATFTGFANVTTGYTLGTSSPVLIVASTTPQTATSSLAARWPSNSYVTFTVNATNTAVCTFGVDYLPN